MKQPSTSKQGRPSISDSPASFASAPEANFADSPLDPEDIARLAHSYWEARGRDGGSPEEDWFRAEQELRERRAAKALGAAAGQ